MCFENNIDQLNKFRSRKRPITVWKTASVDRTTGRAYTQYNSPRDRVWWTKGATVHPHRILGPRKAKQTCSSGLYFNLKRPSGTRTVIKAKVKPKDIIGVNAWGQTICAVAALVVEAPNPDDMRLEFLKDRMKSAQEQRRAREQDMARYLATQEDNEEALQQMLAEAAKLKKLAGK
jgi:hypothetical protein